MPPAAALSNGQKLTHLHGRPVFRTAVRAAAGPEPRSGGDAARCVGASAPEERPPAPSRRGALAAVLAVAAAAAALRRAAAEAAGEVKVESEEPGFGEYPTRPGDLVLIHYTLGLGLTYRDGGPGALRPAALRLGGSPTPGVCAGLQSALLGMRIGGRRTVLIPPELGFGGSPAFAPYAVWARRTALALMAVAALLACHASADEDAVVKLTEETYDDAVSDGKVYFIKYFAPWCGHCKRLEPTWSELAEAYKNHESIQIAKVDCTSDRDVCTDAEIKGYPTLKVIHDGEEVKAYRGARELDALKKFIEETATEVLTETTE